MSRLHLSRLPLRLAGWSFEGPRVSEKKCVVLATPHTSNWDGLLLLSLARSVDMKMSWMIKSEWVKGPMGVVLRPLGAVGIDRSGTHNVVDRMIDAFAQTDELVLVIPPEGTRGRAETWRSGFYHIALGAKVPVVPGYLDYKRKRAGLGPPIWMSGDARKDMDAIRAYYAEMHPTALYPEKFGPIRLREESADEPRA